MANDTYTNKSVNVRTSSYNPPQSNYNNISSTNNLSTSNNNHSNNNSYAYNNNPNFNNSNNSLNNSTFQNAQSNTTFQNRPMNQRQNNRYKQHSNPNNVPRQQLTSSDKLDRLVTINKYFKKLNSFQKTTLNLNTSFTIVKSRSNIFEIGDININSYILDIISLGLKYVPSFNKIDLFYILYSFYISLNRLNNSSIYSFTNTSYITRNNDHKSFNDFLKKQFPLKTKLNSSLYFLDTFRKEFLSHILEFFKKDSNINLSINKLKNILISLKKKEITITTAEIERKKLEELLIRREKFTSGSNRNNNNNNGETKSKAVMGS